MRFSVLSSGSRANCTFLEAGSARILIDCGLSGRQTELRLARLGISPDTLDGIIVTHEHSDHIYGIGTLSRRHGLAVYCTEEAAAFLPEIPDIRHFDAALPFEAFGLRINPFSVVHDASNPVGFSVEADGYKFVHVTDLGRVTPLVRDAIAGADAIVIESNHDEDMLYACDYPWDLKQRILSSHGHLSNEECGQLLSEIWHDGLRHIVLAHISENSNTPELAIETVGRHLSGRDAETFICAGRKQETPLVEVGGQGAGKAAVA